MPAAVCLSNAPKVCGFNSTFPAVSVISDRPPDASVRRMQCQAPTLVRVCCWPPTSNRRSDRDRGPLPEANPTGAQGPFSRGQNNTGEVLWSPVQNTEEIAGPDPVAGERLFDTLAFQNLRSKWPA